MSERVRITDVAPRDGLQNEPGIIPTAEKVRLIEMLIEADVDEIEATSFVSPKWIPQLGDASDVLAGVRDALDRKPNTVRRPVVSALVPNEQGMERAIACRESGLPQKIALFTAASETFNKKNINATIDESIERFRPVVAMAGEHRVPIRIYVSCAVACPFEGPIDPSLVVRTVEKLRTLFSEADWHDTDLDLADTIGVAHTEDIRKLLDAFDASSRSRMTLHLHDTFSRAGACVKEALFMGVRSFDGASGGLGGCPYASTSTKRAPGNIDTEALVTVVHEAGFETGVDTEKLREAGAYAREISHKAGAKQPGGRGGRA